MKLLFIFVFLCYSFNVHAQENEQLQEITINSKINPDKIAKRIALNFAEKYARDFACEILQYRSIMCNNVYCEFNAYQGIMAALDFNQTVTRLPWDNPANHQWLAPLTILRSHPYTAGGNILEIHSVHTSSSWNINQWYTNYTNSFMTGALLLKRVLEVYSPLNAKMTSFFKYTICKMYENQQGEQLVLIEFENKENTFPQKTRLLGKGSILYNATGRYPIRIITTDYVDFYSTWLRAKTYPGVSATRHTLSVEYTLMNGHIYPKSLSFDLVWVKPDIPDNALCYSLHHNSRRNPFKNNLKEKEYYTFSHFMPLDPAKKEFVKKNMHSEYQHSIQYYCAPYEPDKWSAVLFSQMDFEKIKKDLYRIEPLEIQARKNELTGYLEQSKSLSGVPAADLEKYIRFSKEYYKEARERIYPMLFGKPYN